MVGVLDLAALIIYCFEFIVALVLCDLVLNSTEINKKFRSYYLCVIGIRVFVSPSLVLAIVLGSYMQVFFRYLI